MKFGICTPLENAPAVLAAGWDFLEENAQTLLQAQLTDDQWKGLDRVRPSPLPVPAANCLVPASLKITGPTADLGQLQVYMLKLLTRAKQAGITTLVFGSGGARNVPDHFDPAQARDQILAFLKMNAPLAQAQGITLVVEHLNTKECNIITTLEEAMTYVCAVNHKNVQVLLDSYHLGLENEPLSHVQAALPFIKHVHLADVAGRTPPGEAQTPEKSDYRPLFKILKEGRYRGLISVEAASFNDIPATAPRVLNFLQTQWAQA